MSTVNPDFQERVPCSDGSCTGIINEKGYCGTCGKPYNPDEDSAREYKAVLHQETPQTQKRFASLVKFLKISVWILSVVILIGVFHWYYEKDYLDEIRWTSNGTLTLEEAKYFWGGTWFTKNKIAISEKDFFIYKDHFIMGDETTQIPFGKVKKIVFNEGAGIYELIIESEGDFFNSRETFFMRNKDTYETMKGVIQDLSKHRFVISGKKSFFKRLFHLVKRAK